EHDRAAGAVGSAAAGGECAAAGPGGAQSAGAGGGGAAADQHDDAAGERRRGGGDRGGGGEGGRPMAILAELSLMRPRCWAMPLVAALLAGCVSTSAGFWPAVGVSEKNVPCQIVCTWQNNVMMVPDTTKNGTPTPALAGRLYVFPE